MSIILQWGPVEDSGTQLVGTNIKLHAKPVYFCTCATLYCGLKPASFMDKSKAGW